MFFSAILRVSPYASWWVLMSMVRFYLEGNIKEQNIDGSRGGAQGARALRSPPSYLRVWMTPPPPPPLPYLRVWIRPWYFHFSRLPGSWSKRRIFFTVSESINSGRNEHCHLDFLRYLSHCTTCSWVKKIQFKHVELNSIWFLLFLTQVKDESSLFIFPLRYLLLLIVLH